MKARRIIPVILIIVVFVSAVGYLFWSQRPVSQELQASGTVESIEIRVASEVSGRVAEVLVRQGDRVNPGDVLFRLDGDLLQAQRKQVLAALETAKSGLSLARKSLEAAQSGADLAQSQYDLELNAARLADAQNRAAAWSKENPTEFTLPVWYFDKSEEISAARDEVGAAKTLLEQEKTNLETVMQSSGAKDFLKTEERLAKAQAAFLAAKDVLDRATAQTDEDIKKNATEIYDAAKSELSAAQTAYDQLLTEQSARNITEARARRAVAQGYYDSALDRYNQLLSGEESLKVQTASAALKQAGAKTAQAQESLVQAQKIVDQAQAELDLVDIRLSKLVIKAVDKGVIITRSIEPGEIIQPGATAMVLGKLDQLTITVFVPEDRYGQINLNDPAQISVDSFPGEVFTARVTRIADKAEYTPRNVQTDEGRRTTVFAVEVSIETQDGKLKPGMPADVTFK